MLVGEIQCAEFVSAAVKIFEFGVVGERQAGQLVVGAIQPLQVSEVLQPSQVVNAPAVCVNCGDGCALLCGNGTASAFSQRAMYFIENNHEAIIDWETWKRVQEMKGAPLPEYMQSSQTRLNDKLEM